MIVISLASIMRITKAATSQKWQKWRNFRRKITESNEIIILFVGALLLIGYTLELTGNLAQISTESHDDVVLLDSDSKEVKRIFVNYVFSGGAERSDSQDNLSFFLREGVTAPLDDSLIIDYGITSNGVCTVEECMKPKKFLHRNENGIVPRVRVLQRENEGFDFGGHTAMLEELDDEGVTQNYDAFIFLNDGVVGPFTPSYFPSSWHWSRAFLDKFTDESDIRGEIGLVGTSIVCLPKEDRGGLGPKVEAFAFAISRHALEIVRAHGTSFRQHKDKVEAILFGEYNLTKILFKNDINIDCLLNAYRGIDWRNETQCNEQKHPSRKNTYFGTSINPLEVVFHKPYWKGMKPVNEDLVKAYKKFLDDHRSL